MHLKRRNTWPPGVCPLDALNDYTWQRHLAEKTSRTLPLRIIFSCFSTYCSSREHMNCYKTGLLILLQHSL